MAPDGSIDIVRSSRELTSLLQHLDHPPVQPLQFIELRLGPYLYRSPDLRNDGQARWRGRPNLIERTGHTDALGCRVGEQAFIVGTRPVALAMPGFLAVVADITDVQIVHTALDDRIGENPVHTVGAVEVVLNASVFDAGA